MAPNLLQKSSNRYLQLALPENLIPSKRMGKREKYRTRLSHNNHFRMEKELCREWIFSWNTLKEKIMRMPPSEFQRGKIDKILQRNPLDFYNLRLSAPFFRMKWVFSRGCKVGGGGNPPSLIAPHMLTSRLSRAVGGNLVKHLNKHISPLPEAGGLQGVEEKQPLLLESCFVGDRVAPLLRNNEISGNPQVVPPFPADRGFTLAQGNFSKAERLARQPNSNVTREVVSAWENSPCARVNSGTEINPFGNLSINGAHYLLCINKANSETYRGENDFLSDQVAITCTPRGESRTSAGFNNFRIIYSLQEKGKAVARRDKINDDYRNQLAEWRKIAFLYGNLPKKTVARVMRRARQLNGDINSNFLSLLETRLDVTLRRAFFFSTLKGARQWILRGKICVNNQRCTLSGYLLQPGDVVSIIPGARDQFRKEWLNTLDRIKTVAPFDKMQRERRFSFSPGLMRKWYKWSQLWGNSPCWHPKYFSTTQPLFWKKQEKSTAILENFQNVAMEHSSLATAFADYSSAIKKQVQGDQKKEHQLNLSMEKYSSQIRRGDTPVTQMLQGVPFYPGKRKGFHAALAVFDAAKEKSSLAARAQFNRKIDAKQVPPVAGTFLFSANPEKRKHCHWLHEQQAHVVDGCFPLRWNKLFARKKAEPLKNHHRRWSCFKPLHLECSHKHCTLIFLYSPQKLLSPGSINVSLLWKKMGK